MSEISAVGSSGYEAASYASVERKDEEAPAVVVEKAAGLKGEEQQRTQEIFQRAIQPNLRDLDREMELKIRIDATRSPQARFPLLQELIELKAKAFAHTGCSLEEYAKECQKRLEEPSISVVFEGPGKEVKAELFALYALLVGLASNMKNASKFGSYPCPFIKIYEMEKSLGFEIMGNTLLTQELSTLVSLLKIKIEGFVLDIDMCSSRPFYWEVFLPNALKALLFLEKELSPEAFQKQVDLVLQVFFTPSVTKVFPLPENQSPPSSVLLPILIKYVDLNTIKESFDLRHAHLPAWEKEVKWIELHCKGIQHVSPERGAEILQSAREYVEQNIWAYPFSLNASAWTAAKEKALKLVKLAEQRAVA